MNGRKDLIYCNPEVITRALTKYYTVFSISQRFSLGLNQDRIIATVSSRMKCNLLYS